MPARLRILRRLSLATTTTLCCRLLQRRPQSVPSILAPLPKGRLMAVWNLDLDRNRQPSPAQDAAPRLF